MRFTLLFLAAASDCDYDDCMTCAGSAGCVWTWHIASQKFMCFSDDEAEKNKEPVISDASSCGCLKYEDCDSCTGPASEVWCAWCPGVHGWNKCITSDGDNKERCSGYVDNGGTCPKPHLFQV